MAGERKAVERPPSQWSNKETFPFPCLASAALQVISQVTLRRSPEYKARYGVQATRALTRMYLVFAL